MMRRISGLLSLVLVTLLWGSQAGGQDPAANSLERWTSKNGSNILDLRLGWSKGLSSKYSSATGQALIDLSSGRVQVRAGGLDAGASYEVWLVDNKPFAPGHSVRPEQGDARLCVGSLTAGQDGAASLSADLGKNGFRDFDVDLMVVSERGHRVEQSGLLYGSPTLLQRANVALGKKQMSKPEVDRALARLVAEGERLFRDEKFSGNGRTCATCHPSTNNFALDPAFISHLPPRDPLFVAEFVPALAENFEKPQLMREFGLILENTNGFGDLANDFTMRGVPHTLAMRVSLEPAVFDGSTRPPFQRTGWSGDGAPGGGTLREFAIGAVTQHFTKTLNRQPGVDFRLPTDEELDALEAFQLSLGRQQDLNLDNLRLRSPRASAGLVVFQTTGKCFNCHKNAGANAAPAGTQNANFNTGVEVFGHPARPPADDGFGKPGSGTFNTPPVVEAADTGPFFHSNSVSTLEDSVAFYRSYAFNNSPSGKFLGGIALTDAEVVQVGAFLRVINALENIRSASDYLQKAQRTRAARQHVADGMAEIEDAIEVLQEGQLHPKAVHFLRLSRDILSRGGPAGAWHYQQAITLLSLARRELER